MAGWAVRWAMVTAEELRLPATEAWTLVAIGDFANKNSGECWASQRKIASRARLSVRAVRKAIPLLERRDLISRTSKAGYTDTLTVAKEPPDFAQAEEWS